MSLAPSYCPILRWPLDIKQIVHQGQEVLVISDLGDVSPEPTVFPAAFGPIIARFDGKHSLEQILNEASPYGLTQELLLQLVSELDQRLLLVNQKSKSREEEIRQKFAEATVRESSHAGLVYPDDKQELSKQIAAYISRLGDLNNKADGSDSLVSFIAPHIDYRRGWKSYAAGIKAIESVQRPDVIFLLGTSHNGGESVFQLTKKDFASPLGDFKTDKTVVESLASKYGQKMAFQDELLHKKEHSLDLQLPFLGHWLGQELSKVKIVPILIGSFYSHVLKAKEPTEKGEIADFLGYLSMEISNLRQSGKKVLLYGGVDMAHVGQHFGDVENISQNGLEEIHSRDQLYLDAILSADKSALFEHIAEDADKRRICGFPSLYTMLSVLEFSNISTRGQLYDYSQAVDEKTDCIVTFASAGWIET